MSADLSALVSARLCHDLISPMGAIGNGLELMALSRAAGSAEIDLITGSLDSALAKLRFYRLAFGPADDQARLSLDEARSLTDAMFRSRFCVEWRADVADIARDAARRIFLVILCLERSLPTGGAVTLAVAGGAVEIAAEARRTAPPAELWAMLADPAARPELRPDGVQFALLRDALCAAGERLEVAFTPTGARLALRAQARVPA